MSTQSDFCACACHRAGSGVCTCACSRVTTGRSASRSKTRWEGIVEVCKTCERKAVWPFCEHKTNDGSWYRLVVVREVGRG